MSNQFLRTAVLMFLAFPDEDKHKRFNKAFELYKSSPGKDSNSEREYNSGFSDRKLSALMYDLQKVNGIKDLEVYNARTQPATEAVGTDASDIEVKAEFVPSPGTVERSRLRDDFPFLKEKDCPIELKALVSDKLTAFDQYREANAKLAAHANGSAPLTEEQEKEYSKISVDAFEANREIFAELNYYKDHGKVLGKHPVFRSLTLEREVKSMSNDQLLAFVNSSKKFFSTKKAALAKAAGNQVKIDEINAAVAEREEKLALVKKALGLSA